MKCPNCGRHADDGAAECAGCAVVFAKWRPPETRAPSPPAAPAGESGAAGGYLWPLIAAGVLFLAAHRGYRIYAAKAEAKSRAAAAAEQARAEEEDEKRRRREEQAAQGAAAAGNAAAAREARSASLFPAGAAPQADPLKDPAFWEKAKADARARMEEKIRAARENPKKPDYRHMDDDARRANQALDKQLKENKAR